MGEGAIEMACGCVVDIAQLSAGSAVECSGHGIRWAVRSEAQPCTHCPVIMWGYFADPGTRTGEQAIRRDERQRVAKALRGDLAVVARVLSSVLANPAATRDHRQAIAQFLSKDQRDKLRRLLDGDFARMGLFLAALVEEVDDPSTRLSSTPERHRPVQDHRPAIAAFLNQESDDE
jgi:hypothetical protein